MHWRVKPLRDLWTNRRILKVILYWTGNQWRYLHTCKAATMWTSWRRPTDDLDNPVNKALDYSILFDMNAGGNVLVWDKSSPGDFNKIIVKLRSLPKIMPQFLTCSLCLRERDYKYEYIFCLCLFLEQQQIFPLCVFLLVLKDFKVNL